MRQPGHGIYAVMVTPFNTDLSLDEGALRENAAYLVRSDVDVIVSLGSEGEFFSLTDRERRRVVEVVAEQTRGRKPMVCGVSHASTREAAALAYHAREHGADAVMAMPPYLIPTDEVGLHEYYLTVAEAAALPVFIYNAPGRVGLNMSPGLIRSLAGVHGIAGVKQASTDFGELVQLCDGRPSTDFLVIGGTEALIWPALCVGADGSTATAASAIPSVFVELWTATRNHDMQTGRQRYADLAPLRTAYELTGSQAGVVKRLMDMVGLRGGSVRPPTRSPSSEVDRLLALLLRSIQGSERPRVGAGR